LRLAVDKLDQCSWRPGPGDHDVKKLYLYHDGSTDVGWRHWTRAAAPMCRAKPSFRAVAKFVDLQVPHPMSSCYCSWFCSSWDEYGSVVSNLIGMT